MSLSFCKKKKMTLKRQVYMSATACQALKKAKNNEKTFSQDWICVLPQPTTTRNLCSA